MVTGKYDNDGDMPGDSGGAPGRYAMQAAPDRGIPIISQAWRGADPTAENYDINDGPGLDALPSPQTVAPVNMDTE